MQFCAGVEYGKGMSDLSSCELENIPWDEFGTSDDHIVPRQSVDQVNECVAPFNGHKKPEFDVVKSVTIRRPETKIFLQKIEGTHFCTPMKDGKCDMLEGSQPLASESVVPASSNPKFIASKTTLASCDDRIPDECFNGCNLDEDSKANTYIPLDDVLPDPIDLDYFESDNKDKGDDPMYHDLPDIGYFEDIDRMLRCDTTFEEGLTGTTDELSWFSSSSNTIYGSEVTFESGLQSSSSKLSSLNSSSGHHLVNTNWTKTDQPTANLDKQSNFCYQSYPDWLITNGENLQESTQNNQIGLHLKKTEKSLYSPEENKVQHHADHKLLPSAVSTQSRSSQHFPKQNHLLEPASTFFHISNQQAEMEYIHPAHQVPCLQTPSVKFECESDPSAFYNVPDTVINYDPKCMESFANQMYKPPIVTEEKLGKRQRHQLSDTLMPEHQQKQSSFTGKVSTQKFHGYCQEIGADSRVQNASLVPALEVDSSVAQSGSFIASVPDDLSVEATSFQQLQDVIEQLDIRTRLCIRDSLYRLARSAKRRHDFTEQNMSVSKDARGVQCVEAQKKCSEFIDDSETVTNPIDRSIAHLLFTGLPEPTTGSI